MIFTALDALTRPAMMCAMMHWLLLLLALFTCGCEDGSPPAGTDLSTPQSAALFYLKQIKRADPRLARSVCVGTPEQKKWVDALTTMLDGMRKFNEALYTRFGLIHTQMHTELEEAIRMLGDEPLALVSEGKVVSDEKQARIDLPHKGFTSRSQLPIYLRHEKEGWKVDLVSTYANGLPPEQMGAVAVAFNRTRRLGEIFQLVARQVRAGGFRSEAEADKSLAERMAALQNE